ncbi:hypothetical protein BDN71DRAFT_205455 [Pleurotus eryngii]|uniref:Uncharacterized protein n=1 Tax=Pleurotus eryngii TaxID=5323 RepID=A0A9P5ZQV4_PLEER|nr:hypothetical protein BDN71DRAFT_205455 [Pleurotus eryngii]
MAGGRGEDGCGAASAEHTCRTSEAESVGGDASMHDGCPMYVFSGAGCLCGYARRHHRRGGRFEAYFHARVTPSSKVVSKRDGSLLFTLVSTGPSSTLLPPSPLSPPRHQAIIAGGAYVAHRVLMEKKDVVDAPFPRRIRSRIVLSSMTGTSSR